MHIETKFDLGDVVFRKVDLDQVPCQVVGITTDFNGVTYFVVDGQDNGFTLFAAQLSKERNSVLVTTN